MLFIWSASASQYYVILLGIAVSSAYVIRWMYEAIHEQATEDEENGSVSMDHSPANFPATTSPNKAGKKRHILWKWALAAVVCLGVPCFSYWLLFDIGSPLNRASALSCVYAWGRLELLPKTARNIDISTRGSMFTREFTVTFDAPASDISDWLSASPGTNGNTATELSDGSRYYEIEPGEGANRATVIVSPDGIQVTINTSWS